MWELDHHTMFTYSGMLRSGRHSLDVNIFFLMALSRFSFGLCPRVLRSCIVYFKKPSSVQIDSGLSFF